MITANAVLISHENIDLSAHGIETVGIQEASDFLAKSNLSVLGAHCTTDNYQSVLELFLTTKQNKSCKTFLLLYDGLSTRQIMDVFNQIHPSQILSVSDVNKLPEAFAAAFDHYYELEQSQSLVNLVQNKNDELKRLMAKLENKVTDRQDQLESSRLKNINAEKKLATLKKTLVQIYRASSLNEIEHGIAEALKEEFQIDWVKIRRPSQSNFSQKNTNLKYYKVTLKSGQKDFGNLYFFKSKGNSFEKKEKRFLSQVADAVSLSIDRSFQYQKTQDLKKQWEATFDAISDPICLTDENYNILRVNKGYLKKTDTEHSNEHIGKKCYESLFRRDSPCDGCNRNQVFQIRNPARNKQSEVFDVYSSLLNVSEQKTYFQMYRDITQDLNLQRQVIESAKMAELGTISSSIAHELNNPIGGMLNFIQLMKMDLNGKETFYPDILEIEKGIIKCKNIVKNLLGFSRKSFHADIQSISLNDVIDQAIMITELKTRSIGIKITYDPPKKDLSIMGRFNLLTHAIRNILQNSQESLVAKRKKDKSFSGLISLELYEEENHICIRITDNGDGVEPQNLSKIFDPLFTTKDPETNSGLGLTLALQIVEEHNGTINVSVDKDKKLSFKLLFFKSEVQSGPSVF